MYTKPITALKNATGRIDYTLMNDYMFHRVMQECEKGLKGFICSLLHLNPESVQCVTMLNPIALGEKITDKFVILDVKVLLNNAMIINLEIQVEKQNFWDDRSVVYLARIFNNIDKGDPYYSVKPSYHVGILNFTLFPDYPEFYATNKLLNVKKHYIYNDKFTMNVLDLTQIALATDEDKQWQIDDWARLFKAGTWEELYMLAQKNDVFEETCETILKLNQDDVAREWCEMREEGLRIERTWQHIHEKDLEALAKLRAEKDAELAKLQAELQQLKRTQKSENWNGTGYS